MRPARHIDGVNAETLAAWFSGIGEPRYRASQVLRWVHAAGARSFSGMSNLSQALRDRLAEAFTFAELGEPEVVRSRDTTTKLLFRLPPGRGGAPALAESVLIPDLARTPGSRPRLTLCVSSQAGCGMGCTFCATARLGLVRNLDAAEIVGQVRVAMALAAPEAVTNIVFMGMGEPLANYDAVVTALRILTADWGFGISPRRITVSTVGLAPQIAPFVAETRVNLAVSLHATTDAQRARLVPVADRWPLADLLAACRAVPLARRRRITFEYVMLAGENDTDADAERLVGLLHGLRAKVNLIPFNPFPGTRFASSPPQRIERFRAHLHRHGVSATVRASRGEDIQAACGQLAGVRSAA
ncbi:MAG TPA: 23S rRNA (adenine(2503)-C(2))-methyltransferase RlmN [Candidatus Limnocylindria bacterium]|nr:23S rRNA (adenine(2503)-C(2))-methyltransferase RlmN [Candidatus Limnocylindria bacterium]